MTIRMPLGMAARLLVCVGAMLRGVLGCRRGPARSHHVGGDMHGRNAYCGSPILRSTGHASVRQLRPFLMRCGHFVLAPYP